MPNKELQSQVIKEVMGVALEIDGKLRRDRRRRAATAVAIEVATENWSSLYAHTDPDEVKTSLTAFITPKVKERLWARKKEDEALGFVFVITASMIFTWVLQAIIVTAVAALVNWWIQSRLDNEKKLLEISQ